MQITPYHQKMHLNDGDLEPDTKKCPLCGFEVANKGLVVQIKPLILLRKCSACFGASVSRMPKELTLTKYYTTSFSDTWYDSINSERIAKTIHKRVRNFTKLNLVDQISILDYGGGDGSLSLNLANRLINSGTKHVNLTIIDYTRAIPDHRNSAISVTYLQTLPQVLNANFEFIILSAVLEHLVEPVSVLKDLVAHLSSDGIVWIRTPQMFGFFKLISILGRDVPLVFPAHLHDLGQMFWNNISRIEALNHEVEVASGHPAPVELRFSAHPARTTLSFLLKLPWYIFGKYWPFVGGWEATLVHRKRDQ